MKFLNFKKTVLCASAILLLTNTSSFAETKVATSTVKQSKTATNSAVVASETPNTSVYKEPILNAKANENEGGYHTASQTPQLTATDNNKTSTVYKEPILHANANEGGDHVMEKTPQLTFSETNKANTSIYKEPILNAKANEGSNHVMEKMPQLTVTETLKLNIVEKGNGTVGSSSGGYNVGEVDSSGLAAKEAETHHQLDKPKGPELNGQFNAPEQEQPSNDSLIGKVLDLFGDKKEEKANPGKESGKTAAQLAAEQAAAEAKMGSIGGGKEVQTGSVAGGKEVQTGSVGDQQNPGKAVAITGTARGPQSPGTAVIVTNPRSPSSEGLASVKVTNSKRDKEEKAGRANTRFLPAEEIAAKNAKKNTSTSIVKK